MPPMLILWIDATNSIVYEWVKIAINGKRERGREKGERGERKEGREGGNSASSGTI